MHFLEKNISARENPSLILKETKTALIFLFPYAYGKAVRTRLGSQVITNEVAKDSLIGRNLISKYVYGKDYHKALKAQLESYAQKLKTVILEEFDIVYLETTGLRRILFLFLTAPMPVKRLWGLWEKIRCLSDQA